MAAINTGYLRTNRGILKIVEIVIGLILSAMLCSSNYHGHCFGEGRLGYASSLNFVTLIINIVLLVLNLLNLIAPRLERIYSVVCMVLFLIAFIVIVWFLIVNGAYHVETIIVASVLLFVMFLCYLYDIKILQGEVSNL